MEQAHTACILRGVSVSDRTRYRVQWWDKPRIEESLPSGTVGISGVIERLAEVWGAPTFGEAMPRRMRKRHDK